MGWIETIAEDDWEGDLAALRGRVVDPNHDRVDDRDVLDIVEVAAYYAYVNRIADGLGVGIEPWIGDD